MRRTCPSRSENFTTRLSRSPTAGTGLRIEGPFGRLERSRCGQPELWIAGRIGIIPCIAWAQAMDRRHNPVNLVYCVKNEDSAARRAAGDAVFPSRQRRSYTRFGVYRFVERRAARVLSLAGRTIPPRMVRHTSACHLLQAGVDLNTIRAWLGYAGLATTNIYAEIDFEMKAMARCDAAEP